MWAPNAGDAVVIAAAVVEGNSGAVRGQAVGAQCDVAVLVLWMCSAAFPLFELRVDLKMRTRTSGFMPGGGADEGKVICNPFLYVQREAETVRQLGPALNAGMEW